MFPPFTLRDQNDAERRSGEFAGKPFVVYFYPKDDTPGCTVQAQQFSAQLSDFGDVPVLGVSPDPVKKHAKFCSKYDLHHILLADPDRELIDACGLWVEKSMYGKTYMGVDRTTYLVDKDGKVAKVWTKVKPDGNAAEVLEALKAL